MDWRQRDPHFRVYTGGATYFWSFEESGLIRFEGDRWTLEGTGREQCDEYNARPAEYKQLYRERLGFAVTEANFCCDTGEPIG